MSYSRENYPSSDDGWGDLESSKRNANSRATVTNSTGVEAIEHENVVRRAFEAVPSGNNLPQDDDDGWNDLRSTKGFSNAPEVASTRSVDDFSDKAPEETKTFDRKSSFIKKETGHEIDVQANTVTESINNIKGSAINNQSRDDLSRMFPDTMVQKFSCLQGGGPILESKDFLTKTESIASFTSASRQIDEPLSSKVSMDEDFRLSSPNLIDSNVTERLAKLKILEAVFNGNKVLTQSDLNDDPLLLEVVAANMDFISFSSSNCLTRSLDYAHMNSKDVTLRLYNYATTDDMLGALSPIDILPKLAFPITFLDKGYLLCRTYNDDQNQRNVQEVFESSFADIVDPQRPSEFGYGKLFLYKGSNPDGTSQYLRVVTLAVAENSDSNQEGDAWLVTCLDASKLPNVEPLFTAAECDLYTLPELLGVSEVPSSLFMGELRGLTGIELGTIEVARKALVKQRNKIFSQRGNYLYALCVQNVTAPVIDLLMLRFSAGDYSGHFFSDLLYASNQDGELTNGYPFWLGNINHPPKPDMDYYVEKFLEKFFDEEEVQKLLIDNSTESSLKQEASVDAISTHEPQSDQDAVSMGQQINETAKELEIHREFRRVFSILLENNASGLTMIKSAFAVCKEVNKVSDEEFNFFISHFPA